jgi:thiol-disulfide isomerase/thioredoxin
MDYYNKYLEYKLKYLKLKENHTQSGGNNNSKPGIYLFKAEWCGHCKSFKNDWNNLQTDKELNKKINFITFDSEKNVNQINEWKVSGYPTIMLKKGDNAIEYFGSRDVESIKKFINENI